MTYEQAFLQPHASPNFANGYSVVSADRTLHRNALMQRTVVCTLNFQSIVLPARQSSSIQYIPSDSTFPLVFRPLNT